MTKNGCESVACKCAAEASIKEAASMSAVSHNHARLPGILRYRGMENEAAMAARLIKIESFIANLRSILGDLEASMTLATPTVCCLERSYLGSGTYVATCGTGAYTNGSCTKQIPAPSDL